MPTRSQRCLFVPVAGSLFLPEAAPVTNATPGNILVSGEDILILKWEVLVVSKTSEVSGPVYIYDHRCNSLKKRVSIWPLGRSGAASDASTYL